MDNNVKLLIADGWDEATAKALAEGRVSSSAAKKVQAKEKTIQSVIASLEIEEDFAVMDKAIDDRKKEIEHEDILEGIWQAYEKAYFEDLVEYDKALKVTPGKYKDLLDELASVNAQLNDKALRAHQRPALRERATALHKKIQQARIDLTQEERELAALQLYDVITSGAWEHVERYHPSWLKKIDHELVKSYKPELFEEEAQDDSKETK